MAGRADEPGGQREAGAGTGAGAARFQCRAVRATHGARRDFVAVERAVQIHEMSLPSPRSDATIAVSGAIGSGWQEAAAIYGTRRRAVTWEPTEEELDLAEAGCADDWRGDSDSAGSAED